VLEGIANLKNFYPARNKINGTKTSMKEDTDHQFVSKVNGTAKRNFEGLTSIKFPNLKRIFAESSEIFREKQ